MKKLALKTLVLFFVIGLAACSTEKGNPTDNLSSVGTGSTDSAGPAETPGVTLDGGDQGREGGHFLICDPESGIPDSRMEFENDGQYGNEKAFFLDYFLQIQTEDDRAALKNFTETETDEVRLDRVTKRLLFIFRKHPQMKIKAQRLDAYAASFMERKGEAQWIESTEDPSTHPMTEDFTPAHLNNEDLLILSDHCQARFFQAAVYDYSQPGREIFYYSEFFERNASLMQKSFRNVHEMLRFTMRNETPQVVALTAYFHTTHFFTASSDSVKEKIAAISEETQTNVRFF